MYKRKPKWLKIKLESGRNINYVEQLIADLHLNSVCSAAKCPNRAECYSNKTATFMILGNICTRGCRFCNITQGHPSRPDNEEPKHIVEAIEKLKLTYAVITSVTRDDLVDGGAEHFYNITTEIRKSNCEIDVELLIPDFNGNKKSIQKIIDSKPIVINHNMESIARLYKSIRPGADYQRSLDLLKYVKQKSNIITKSGIMLGLGEQDHEVKSLLKDLLNTGCDLLTISQYLSPGKEHLEVCEYITPDKFKFWNDYALELGFKGVASGPLVRSSYNARSLMCTI